ncbi:hypothetical protein EZS27_040810 [termite gut metagenome]|uniref:Uncharacterized protein n=1 Tax=termite gut metagenome TaxID=433724 RepID=A0A5J4PF42_9ZZZZ
MTIEQKILPLLSQCKKLGIDKQIDYDKFYLYSLITHSTAIDSSIDETFCRFHPPKGE